MNRARDILAEWDAHVARHGMTIPRDADLRRKLTTKTQQCTLLERQLQAAAVAIAAPTTTTKPSEMNSASGPQPSSSASAPSAGGRDDPLPF